MPYWQMLAWPISNRQQKTIKKDLLRPPQQDVLAGDHWESRTLTDDNQKLSSAYRNKISD